MARDNMCCSLWRRSTDPYEIDMAKTLSKRSPEGVIHETC